MRIETQLVRFKEYLYNRISPVNFEQ